MTLGDMLRQYREENRISMDEFSSKSGISKGYISMLENNINPRSNKPIAPTLPTMRKVAIGMNTDIDTVLKALDSEQEICLSDETRELYTDKATPEEFENIIKKYRDLDVHGREMVDFTLEKEYMRSTSIKEKSKIYNFETQKPMTVAKDSAHMTNAAHKRTDIEVTDKMKKHDEDIMDDENF